MYGCFGYTQISEDFRTIKARIKEIQPLYWLFLYFACGFKEVTKKLRNSTTVGWQKRESVRAKLRILVRRPLRRYKYPPDKQKVAMELVMKQAELLANEWSR